MKRLLTFDITSQDSCCLSEFLLDKRHKFHVIKRYASSLNMQCAENIYEYHSSQMLALSCATLTCFRGKISMGASKIEGGMLKFINFGCLAQMRRSEGIQLEQALMDIYDLYLYNIETART